MGKGMTPKRGYNQKKYAQNYVEPPAWKKETKCWTCPLSYACEMRYQSKECKIGQK